MPHDLTPIQLDVVAAVAGFEPPFTLTGGAALIGAHGLRHRTTSDIDLFWRERNELEWLTREVVNRISKAGLEVEVALSRETFARLNVTRGDEGTIVDLVAVPGEAIEAPEIKRVGSVEVPVDTPHELLVNKLTALLSRSEVRDLVDIGALLEHGADLEAALRDAPKKDGGFSGVTLAWLLGQFPVDRMARKEGLSDAEVERVTALRDRLLKMVAALDD